MKTTFTFLLVLLSVGLFAQDTLNNFGLNTWESSGKQPPFDWQEPKGWTSSNSLTEFISAGVVKTEIPQSGSVQAQIKTLNVFGQNVPGLLINGDFPISISDTGRVPLLGGEPMTTVKTKAYGLYNFASSDTTDSATVIIAFKKFNTNTGEPDAVAMGTISLAQTPAGALYPFVIDVQTMTNDQPDSVVVTMISSGTSDFKTGGILTVDFIMFTQPLGVPVISSPRVLVYPNPAKDEAFIDMGGYNYTNYTVTDIMGKTISGNAIEAGTMLQRIDLNGYKNGVYFVTLTNNTEVKTIKFIKE